MTGIEVRALAASEVGRLEQEEPPGRGFARAMWALQEAGGSTLLVAWDGDRPVGAGQLDLRGDVPELRNLRVDEAERGRGIGTAIMRAAEERVGSGPLAVGVGLDNPRARALYERLGYRGTGENTTTTYAYVDDAGVTRRATETDEMLVRARG
ncbi:GNAT family N-acetyltransferase [Clavibacter sepedonicus]|uniref:Acetyl transferase n=1 Tax=Clavibacter sepedonicus TaxID=31964 RepID=B0RBJ2_CLASE|nr:MULTISPECIES: GNAT family N-acetyltransferase [Clavibacter]MBD5383334.1 GNAT family N-acetyltransferase [Clavibacter sp.]OQJ48410.1 N-acetyltransferase [Clavibacter sepedonicus]OQJ53892.1 N-acetyltransferase [Clavibacter sepedonicus]UUK65409.1 GNAT family N-acetyltransferase [Clavibacter sepedonicus]CAQ02888.1 putative acetyl transferase [Clavibacter sepedonicus]